MLLHTWEGQGSLTKEVVAEGFRRTKRGLANSGEGGGHGRALQVERAASTNIRIYAVWHGQ